MIDSEYRRDVTIFDDIDATSIWIPGVLKQQGQHTKICFMIHKQGMVSIMQSSQKHQN